MNKILMSVVVFGVVMGAFATVVEIAADGTTFDVTDGVLTITVPSGQTNNGYDYVANVLNAQTITQVVKDGAGTLVGRSAPNYQGAWHVKAGFVTIADNVNGVFGAVPASATEATKLTIDSGATVKTGKTNSFNGRLVEIAGGVSSGATGALFFTGSCTAAGATFRLTGDAQRYDDTSNAIFSGGVLDVAGHAFHFGGRTYANGFLQGSLVVTNSSSTPGRIVTPWTTEFKTHFGTVNFLGGAENVLDLTQAGRTYIEGPLRGDWTFRLRSNMRGTRALSTTTDKSGANGWYSSTPIVITNTLTVGNADANGKVTSDSDGFGFVVNAPVTGDSSAKINVGMGAWISFGGTSSTYEGGLQLYGQNYNANRRCTVFFQKDMPFVTQPSKTVSIADSDIWMDAETVRQISSFNVTAGASTIAGSAAGSSIPSITMAGTLNTLDTPASIGTYTLNAGTLAIGTRVPDITNLVCAVGTTIDLGGQNVTVQTLSGLPTIVNGGTLTMTTGSLDVQASGGVVLPPELHMPGTLTVTWCGGAFPGGEHEIFYLAPGMTVPTFSGTAVAGGELAFTTRVVASGPHAGYTAVVATVTPQAGGGTHFSTAPDGTTFEAADQVLVITVPAAVTNTTDYAPIVADCLVTNIVKAGAGALDAVAMTTYDGDITILDGEFLVIEDGDFGRKNSGTVRVKAGGAIRVKNSPVTGAITYKTLELEGNGPDGLGAVRSPKVAGKSNPFRYMTYRLTGDTGWLNDKTRLDPDYSTLDVAGHEFKILSSGTWSQMGYFDNCQITNSVPEQGGSVLVGTVAGGSNPKLQLDRVSSWLGGTNNLIRSTNRTYLGKQSGDWTLVLDGGAVWGANGGTDVTATNNNYFTGPVWVKNANGYFSLNDSASACTIALYGPIYSTSDAVTLNLNCIMHLYSDMSGFQGAVSINGTPNSYYKGRNGVWIHDGCLFHCGAGKRVGIKNSDLTLGEGTAFRLPSFKHTGGEIQVAGGPRGDSSVGRAVFESFENTADTLIFDSPAIVAGEMKVAAGTLALATNDAVRTETEMPVFSNLVFSAGTTFDMHGKAISIPNLTGTPTVANAAEITITGSYRMANEVFTTPGAVTFAPGSKVFIPTGTRKRGSYLVMTAAGGASGAPEPEAEDGRNRFWKIRVNGTSVVLEYVGGLSVIFR